MFEDPNSETTVYITQTFALAVLPGIKKLDNAHVKGPEWKQGLTDGTWSAEIYLNPNYGHTMIVTHTGGFAVLK